MKGGDLISLTMKVIVFGMMPLLAKNEDFESY